MNSVLFRRPIQNFNLPDQDLNVKIRNEQNVGSQQSPETPVDFQFQIQQQQYIRASNESSQDQMIWNEYTVPQKWTWNQPKFRNPRRQSTCELELDTTAENIVNKQQASKSQFLPKATKIQDKIDIYDLIQQLKLKLFYQLKFNDLQTASESQRLVDTLDLIWQEEQTRLGYYPKPPISDPPKHVSSLSFAVDAHRYDYQKIEQQQYAQYPNYDKQNQQNGQSDQQQIAQSVNKSQLQVQRIDQNPQSQINSQENTNNQIDSEYKAYQGLPSTPQQQIQSQGQDLNFLKMTQAANRATPLSQQQSLQYIQGQGQVLEGEQVNLDLDDLMQALDDVEDESSQEDLGQGVQPSFQQSLENTQAKYQPLQYLNASQETQNEDKDEYINQNQEVQDLMQLLHPNQEKNHNNDNLLSRVLNAANNRGMKMDLDTVNDNRLYIQNLRKYQDINNINDIQNQDYNQLLASLQDQIVNVENLTQGQDQSIQNQSAPESFQPQVRHLGQQQDKQSNFERKTNQDDIQLNTNQKSQDQDGDDVDRILQDIEQADIDMLFKSKRKLLPQMDGQWDEESEVEQQIDGNQNEKTISALQDQDTQSKQKQSNLQTVGIPQIAIQQPQLQFQTPRNKNRYQPIQFVQSQAKLSGRDQSPQKNKQRSTQFTQSFDSPDHRKLIQTQENRQEQYQKQIYSQIKSRPKITPTQNLQQSVQQDENNQIPTTQNQKGPNQQIKMQSPEEQQLLDSQQKRLDEIQTQMYSQQKHQSRIQYLLSQQQTQLQKYNQSPQNIMLQDKNDIKHDLFKTQLDNLQSKQQQAQSTIYNQNEVQQDLFKPRDLQQNKDTQEIGRDQNQQLDTVAQKQLLSQFNVAQEGNDQSKIQIRNNKFVSSDLTWHGQGLRGKDDASLQLHNQNSQIHRQVSFDKNQVQFQEKQKQDSQENQQRHHDIKLQDLQPLKIPRQHQEADLELRNMIADFLNNRRMNNIQKQVKEWRHIENKSNCIFQYSQIPPTNEYLFNTIHDQQVHKFAYYENPNDLPEQPVVKAGRLFKFKSDHPTFLEPAMVPDKDSFLEKLHVDFTQRIKFKKRKYFYYHINPPTNSQLVASLSQGQAQDQDLGIIWSQEKKQEDPNNVEFDPCLVATSPKHEGHGFFDNLKPASPKYDQRSHFYFSNAATSAFQVTNMDQQEDNEMAQVQNEQSVKIKKMKQIEQQIGVHTQESDKASIQKAQQQGMGQVDFENNYVTPQQGLSKKSKTQGTNQQQKSQFNKRQDTHPLQNLFSRTSVLTPLLQTTVNKSIRTPLSQVGFQFQSQKGSQGVLIAAVEILAESREDLLPNPNFDQLLAISISVMDDAYDQYDPQITTFLLVNSLKQNTIDMTSHTQRQIKVQKAQVDQNTAQKQKELANQNKQYEEKMESNPISQFGRMGQYNKNDFIFDTLRQQQQSDQQQIIQHQQDNIKMQEEQQENKEIQRQSPQAYVNQQSRNELDYVTLQGQDQQDNITIKNNQTDLNQVQHTELKQLQKQLSTFNNQNKELQTQDYKQRDQDTNNTNLIQSQENQIQPQQNQSSQNQQIDIQQQQAFNSSNQTPQRALDKQNQQSDKMNLNQNISEVQDQNQKHLPQNETFNVDQPNQKTPQVQNDDPSSKYASGTKDIYGMFDQVQQVKHFNNEKEMIEAFCLEIRIIDPDIILGFDIQKGSLGYIQERAQLCEVNVMREISRTPGFPSIRELQDDEYGKLNGSGMHTSGRIILNLFRILRMEIKLTSYSYENSLFNILSKRVPEIPFRTLTKWFRSQESRWLSLRNITSRSYYDLRMVYQLDLVGRTGELAKVFGIDFQSVLTRGSQYRVESMTLRLAHTQNFLGISPSRKQVEQQPGMDQLPLVLEPQSRLYVDPVIVLDFQSLYPSLVIAYNLCYTTCIGKLPHTQRESKLGVSSYKVDDDLFPKLGIKAEDLIIAPNGSVFLPPKVRKGILPRLLREILDTRIMVKDAMKKLDKSQKGLHRCMNARQYGLKMISNVTYGYTAAGFSGRMPFAELADAIVSSARATLEQSIEYVEKHPKWKAKIVYGDTDSLFVLLPGRTLKQAFEIGYEIQKEITARNPSKIALKLDKIYLPCILQTKKRYVGNLYENPNQTKPILDAKGIEMIRRDQCPCVAKIMEKSLKILFNTKNLSTMKLYLQNQWLKIHQGRVCLYDFIFYKDVRLGTYSNVATPAAALVAAKNMQIDPRREPSALERVPYVVVYGTPNARLMDLVVDPHIFLQSKGRLKINAIYYITKMINPSLDRLYSLLGVDVASWYKNMPKLYARQITQKRNVAANPELENAQTQLQTGLGLYNTLEQYYNSKYCSICDQPCAQSKLLCDNCAANKQRSYPLLRLRVKDIEERQMKVWKLCRSCGAHDKEMDIACKSLDCLIFFERDQINRELRNSTKTLQMIFQEEF